MSDNNNFQELAKKLRDKRLNVFYDLVEKNQMNYHFITNCESEISEAMKNEDDEMVSINKEQQEAYLSLYEKNVSELNILMEQLGFNNINFRLN